ncbi:mitochondrial import receptor subunit TOM70-like [Watersipora subatra]|uniref:mitochondrial import receptor subunit TOM70-like n=1 Tax=Watersipora subatra TaxID=2589382 RepID=UPI00355BD08B
MPYGFVAFKSADGGWSTAVKVAGLVAVGYGAYRLLRKMGTSGEEPVHMEEQEDEKSRVAEGPAEEINRFTPESTAPLRLSFEAIKETVNSMPSDPVLTKLPEFAQASNRAFQRACAKVLTAQPIAAILEDLNKDLRDEESIFHPEALYLRAIAYSIGGYPGKAEQDFEALLSSAAITNRLRSTVWLRKAVSQMTTTYALKYARRAEMADKTNPDVYFIKGQISLLTQRVPLAADEFRQASEISSVCHPIIRMHQLVCDFHSEDTLKKMEQLCCFNPAVSTLWVVFGQCLMASKKYQKLNAILTKASEYNPESARLVIQQAALALNWKGDRKRAYDCLFKAKDIDEDLNLVYENLAALLLQDGKIEEAVQMLKEQVRTSRTLVERRFALQSLESATAKLQP